MINVIVSALRKCEVSFVMMVEESLFWHERK